MTASFSPLPTVLRFAISGLLPLTALTGCALFQSSGGGADWKQAEVEFENDRPILIIKKDGQTKREVLNSSDEDGEFGAARFRGKVWRFDYPKKNVFYADSLDAPLKHVPAFLGFRIISGERTSNVPRIPTTIDGQIHQMVFDTGDSASFVRQSVFDRWKRRHPAWKVVPSQGTTPGSIEVPEIIIGGQKAGPVWFTVKRDRVFDQLGIMVVDQKVEGSVGGNVFREFRITIDYPNATAWFEK